MPLNIINHHYIRLQADDPVVTLILAKLAGISSRQDAIMVDITKLTTDIAALTGAVTGADNDFASLRTQIATLTATIAAGNPITQAQVDALDATVAGAVSNLNAAVAIDSPPAAAPAAAPTAAPAAEPAPAAATSPISTDAPSTPAA